MSVSSSKRRVLVLGATGMLGNAVVRYLGGDPQTEVFGTLRSARMLGHFPPSFRDRLVTGIDVENVDGLISVMARVRPDVVVNCVGAVKQLADAADPLVALPLNALLPHRLARLCAASGARLIHVSTDCVFNGQRGNYTEEDTPDATDLYGRSKLLGEVDYENAITLRTSIIGHELDSSHGLVDWFLSQSGTVRGYSRAVFSGLTTVELARVIGEHVVTRPELRGLYHVSVAPIDKCSLLGVIAAIYGKATEIIPSDQPVIDRSLCSGRFRSATGYSPPEWPDMIQAMCTFYGRNPASNQNQNESAR